MTMAVHSSKDSAGDRRPDEDEDEDDEIEEEEEEDIDGSEAEEKV
jgi:hypothetical protein